MELMKFIAVLLLITVTEINATKVQNAEGTDSSKQNFNPLASLVLNQNSSESTKDLVRVKRQYYPDPYYYGRGPYYPVPIPIFVGGLGFGGFGRGFRRGFGGRGFGGRGFGGRGFGGRGFGGRGFGGRGFGGRGGFGGGRGGGRG
ncbi:H/ACA ribonucleoprotein complex subunit 1-like [Leguminivora glycinivorella]|uniref:H/ACA ribonucleoprotein complex subunit 1-like n=1 Tax=Leguminivora glycinivorella TaxID=1035111 RepID=UPI00200E3FD5|nr:H/ACA ribonucleoprotein complex subunit 1-like [Leguminivora glycinivorella]